MSQVTVCVTGFIQCVVLTTTELMYHSHTVQYRVLRSPSQSIPSKHPRTVPPKQEQDQWVSSHNTTQRYHNHRNWQYGTEDEIRERGTSSKSPSSRHHHVSRQRQPIPTSTEHKAHYETNDEMEPKGKKKKMIGRLSRTFWFDTQWPTVGGVALEPQRTSAIMWKVTTVLCYKRNYIVTLQSCNSQVTVYLLWERRHRRAYLAWETPILSPTLLVA